MSLLLLFQPDAVPITPPGLGTVFLGGVRLTVDPLVYERSWPRRASWLPGLDGAVTVQDFGRTCKDLVLRLESGGGQWLEQAAARQLDLMARAQGTAYRFTDWNGLQGTAVILAFDADPTFVATQHQYRMVIRLLALATLYGQPYTGS